MKRYMESVRNASAPGSSLSAERTEDATVVRADVRNRAAHGKPDVRVSRRLRITVRVPTTREQDYPATLISERRTKNAEPVQVGDLLQLDRDRERQDNRHARILKSNQFSKETIILTVGWYKNQTSSGSGSIPTEPPRPLGD